MSETLYGVCLPYRSLSCRQVLLQQLRRGLGVLLQAAAAAAAAAVQQQQGGPTKAPVQQKKQRTTNARRVYIMLLLASPVSLAAATAGVFVWGRPVAAAFSGLKPSSL